MALPLIKHDAADAAIDLLTKNVPVNDPLLDRFNDYFQNQWIMRIPMTYWNIGPKQIRCNNAVEGIISRLRISNDKRSLLAS